MIWLIGNKGMLGSSVEKKLKTSEFNFSTTDLNVDITNIDALVNYAAKIFTTKDQNWIINCSAYTAVDRAEDEPELAEKINSLGVENIANCAKKNNAKLIHISTDYVFAGTNPEAITEDMSPNPVSVYGNTKLKGENAIQKSINSYFIIRTAWLYGLYGFNFVYTMLKLMNSRNSISVVNDQFGSPTNAKDLADLIVTIVSKESTDYGTYHYSNEGKINWYDFAEKIYEIGKQKKLINSDCNIKACSSSEFPTKATRPNYSLLSKEKVKTTFQIPVPQWEESLSSFFIEFNQTNNRVINWIEHSLYDFDTAVAMNSSGRYLYVLLTSQQSIEKQLKAIYEFKGEKIPRLHDLLRLASGLELHLSDSQAKLFTELSYYYVASRYHERVQKLSVKIDKNLSNIIIEQTKEILSWLKSMIPFV